MAPSRSWFPVYRVFVDRGIIEQGDFESFRSLLQSIMGESAPSLNVHDLRFNVEVLSFAQPVSLWSKSNAPIGGKKFDDYLEVAHVTNQALR